MNKKMVAALCVANLIALEPVLVLANEYPNEYSGDTMAVNDQGIVNDTMTVNDTTTSDQEAIADTSTVNDDVNQKSIHMYKDPLDLYSTITPYRDVNRNYDDYIYEGSNGMLYQTEKYRTSFERNNAPFSLDTDGNNQVVQNNTNTDDTQVMNDNTITTDDTQSSSLSQGNESTTRNNNAYTNDLNTHYIEDMDEVNNVKIKGKLPQLRNVRDSKFQSRINTMITEVYKDIYDTHEEDFDARYEVYQYNNLVSIVLYFDTVNEVDITNASANKKDDGKSFVKTIVFDRITMKEVTLKDLYGDDYKNILNTEIKNQIGNDENTAYHKDQNQFKSIDNNHSFYVDQGNVVTIFNKNTIAPANAGTPMFKIPYTHSMNLKIGKEDYFTHENQDFVSLAVVLQLGMELNYNEDRTIDVLSNGNRVSTVYLDENKYVDEHGTESTLSSKPILANGYIVAVPYDFFHNFMDLSVNKDLNNNIIMKSNEQVG